MFIYSDDHTFQAVSAYKSFLSGVIETPNIDPTIITEEETRWVDVNSDYNLDYGRSLSYKRQGPVGTQKARILFSIDEERFWDLMVDLLTQ